MKQYSQRGERVFAACRNPTRAEDLESLLSKFPKNISIHSLDVSNQENIRNLHLQVEKATDSLNMLNHKSWRPTEIEPVK
ncbi:hypothetical protein L0156_25200 [bacterium]|nr:hypothetical protein [bacterium]